MTEASPLLASASPAQTVQTIESPTEKRDWLSYLSPFIISFLVTLPIILIPGVQNAIFGQRGGEFGTGARINGWIGGTLGTVVSWLGAVYPVLEILGTGGGLRKTDG